MYIAEAHELITTGYRRYARGAKSAVLFAVFVDEEYNVKIMHMTDKREGILNRDLKFSGRIYHKYCGTYNLRVSLDDFAEDIQYNYDLLTKKRKGNGLMH